MAITPENIGNLYPTKMPSLEDSADIQRALRIYHYGAIPGTGVGEYDPLNTNIANLKNPSMAYTLNDLQTQIDGIESGVLQNSIFAAKGDLISASANDTPVILSAGTNNQVLTVNSATASGLSWANTLSGLTLSAPTINTPTFTGDVPQLSKNFIINGDCSVKQRWESASLIPSTSAQFPVDHIFARRSAGSSGATTSYISSGLASIINAVRMQRDSGNTSTNTLIVGQTVETQISTQLQGKPVVFSFWARKGANYSAASDALQVRVYTGTGYNQSGLGTGYTGTATPISGTATLTTSWQRFTFTGNISSTATQVQVVTQYVPAGTAGANDYFDITGLQLEIGASVTPFSLAGGGSYNSELALCRRYYERLNAGTGFTVFGRGYALNSTQALITFDFNIPKRCVSGGSVEWLSYLFLALRTSGGNFQQTGFNYTDYTNYNDFTITNLTATITASSASFTAGQYVEFISNGVAGAYIGFWFEIG